MIYSDVVDSKSLWQCGCVHRPHVNYSAIQIHRYLGSRVYNLDSNIYSTSMRTLIARRLLRHRSICPIITTNTTSHILPTSMGANMSTSAPATSSFPVQKSSNEWRTTLSPEQFRILREKGTESPGSGEYNNHKPSSGVYNCAGCDTPLYKATTKFSSGCGWPSFFEGIPGAIVRREDGRFGVKRTEILCANCGGHLGYVP